MPKTQSYEITIRDLDCADCAAKLKKSINQLPGIQSATIDFLNSKLTANYDTTVSQPDDIIKAVKQSGHAPVLLQKRQQSTLFIEEMDCPDEARPIENRLKKIAGVTQIQFNLLARQVTVEHDIPVRDIQQAIRETGFESELADSQQSKPKLTFWQKRKMLILTTISGTLAITGTILSWLSHSETQTIPFLLLAILIGGFHIAVKGCKEVRSLRLGMNFLMTIAVIGAILIGEWSEAAMVVFLFALAQLLESYSIRRARQSIESLLDLAPNVARIKIENGYKTIPVDNVQLGDIILIKPGERIPLDGIVISGSSTVNQAPITGESIPAQKTIHDETFAGSINENGTLEIRVNRRSDDSTLARIIHLVEQAQAQKAPSQNFVEKFAQYYTPAVVIFSVILALLPPLLLGGEFIDWFYRALVLLVISCPCALVISTPVTIVSGLTNAARHGILIKGGAYLENFGRLKALAFDKTGTLTHGRPLVKTIIPHNSYDRNELLSIAASLEANSEHHLANAILRCAETENITLKPVKNFAALTGRGVRGEIAGEMYYLGNHRLFEENSWCEEKIHQHLEQIENQNHTAVILGNKSKILGIISIADTLRENAAPAIQALHRAGIEKTIMLTGDNRQTAASIARKLQIDEYKAELLPEDKVHEIKQLIQKYQQVAMVGDGINDAPALAAATMGISLGITGTDTALETADIALMKDDLGKLAYLKNLSRRTLRIIKQNISIALLLKGIFVILAIPGLATLWMAVFADMGASLIVVANGLRALKDR